jgi:hypothetical protein
MYFKEALENKYFCRTRRWALYERKSMAGRLLFPRLYRTQRSENGGAGLFQELIEEVGVRWYME